VDDAYKASWGDAERGRAKEYLAIAEAQLPEFERIERRLRDPSVDGDAGGRRP
jgi:hypothetical protein